MGTPSTWTTPPEPELSPRQRTLRRLLGLAWLAMLVLAGVIGFPMVQDEWEGEVPGSRVQGPGAAIVDLDARTYLLWGHNRTIRSSTNTSICSERDERQREATQGVTLTALATGGRVEPTSAKGCSRSFGPGGFRVAVTRFEVAEAGPHRFAVARGGSSPWEYYLQPGEDGFTNTLRFLGLAVCGVLLGLAGHGRTLIMHRAAVPAAD